MSVPDKYKTIFDKVKWGKKFNPANDSFHTEEAVNEFIVRRLMCYGRKDEDSQN